MWKNHTGEDFVFVVVVDFPHKCVKSLCLVTTFGQVPQYLLDEAVRSGYGSKVMN